MANTPPNVLETVSRFLVTDPEARRPVFAYYNPYLLTFPIKLVLQSKDHSELGRAIKQITDVYKMCDYIVLKDKAYIELVPPHLAKITAEIPDASFEINQYRIRNNIRRPSNILIANNRS
jgi:hypothetical protein